MQYSSDPCLEQASSQNKASHADVILQIAEIALHFRL